MSGKRGKESRLWVDVGFCGLLLYALLKLKLLLMLVVVLLGVESGC